MIRQSFNRILKVSIGSTVLLLFVLACKKGNSSTDNAGGGGTVDNNSPATIVTFGNRENYNISGSAVVTFTDATFQTAKYSNGVLRIPLSAGGDKIIQSIAPNNTGAILIGRKEGDNIKLNFDGSTLHLRTDVYGGATPIGSFAEFQLINTDATTKAANYTLEADLDLMSQDWVPVVCKEFDGLKHELRNIKVNVSSGNAAGVFEVASKIRSLTIRSGTVNATGKALNIRMVGGICALVTSISDCNNYASVHITGISFTAAPSVSPRALNAGGLAGIAGYVANCKNYGDITIDGVAQGLDLQRVGGVVGSYQPADDLSVILTSCSNSGKITIGYSNFSGNDGGSGESSSVGGIVGTAASYNSHVGLSGHYTALALITDCQNEGTINVDNFASSVGGIVGYGVAKNCTNKAGIKSKTAIAGGIAGYMLVTLKGLAGVSNNINSGAVTSSSYTGGIAAESEADLESCTNSGLITSTRVGAAGIVGACFGNIKKCSNSAAISSENSLAGGIVASFGSETPIVISECVSTGDVTGGGGIGGICGETGGSSTVQHCSNSGNIKASGFNGFVGGIIGEASGGHITISSSYNTGKVSGVADIGGVAGGFTENNTGITVTGSYNTGAVTATGNDVGGVVGRGYVVSSYNTGAVNGPGNVGGVTGNGSAYQSYNIGSVTGNASNVGGIVGFVTDSYVLTNGFNYWKDITTDNAKYAYGNNPGTAASQFSAASWPDASQLWKIGDGAWKSLGSWNNGNPTYPQLYFQ